MAWLRTVFILLDDQWMKFCSELFKSKLDRKLLNQVYLAFLQTGTLTNCWQVCDNVCTVFVEVTLRCFTPTYPNFKTNFHGMNTRLTLSYVGNTRTPYKFQVFSSLATAYLQYAIIKSFHPSQAWQPFFNPLL